MAVTEFVVAPAELVLLFDVDNTLIDNDTVQEQLHDHLARQFGEEAAHRYWVLYEEQRQREGFADYLGALQRYRLEDLNDPRLLGMSEFLLDYPFHDRLFPGALDAVHHASTLGRPVILSDGDAVFQPRKVHLAGLWKAFHGHVLIYVHKEHMLANIEHWYPAHHYVVVDDKVAILDAIKQQWGERVTTVFVRQGHYANDQATLAKHPPADVDLGSIAELTGVTAAELTGAALSRP
jgi:FMN phosphatase YigB (HAD superfamily)